MVNCKYQDFSTPHDLNFEIINVYGAIDMGNLNDMIQPVLDTRVPAGECSADVIYTIDSQVN